MRFHGTDAIIIGTDKGGCAIMRSMTGCGNGRVQRDGWEVTAELKTVNHRFLDISMRLPRNIAFLEQTVRETLSAGLKRGHADVFISVRKTDAFTRSITSARRRPDVFPQVNRICRTSVSVMKRADRCRARSLQMKDVC